MTSRPERMRLDAVARLIADSVRPRSMPVRVTAIDGPGGSGKSTLAARISAALGGAPVVPTDDFASWDEPLDWWPRLLEQVLVPLAASEQACYRRYDWPTRRLQEWIEVPPAPQVVIEGVGSSRIAFRPYLSFSIWVDTPRAVRLARGLERDGEAMRSQWEQWMADEDRYINDEAPDRHADLIVCGAPTIEHDADREVVAWSERGTGTATSRDRERDGSRGPGTGRGGPPVR